MELLNKEQVCKTLNIKSLDNLIKTGELSFIIDKKDKVNKEGFSKNKVAKLKKEYIVTFNQKIELSFKKDDESILDGQSKICNWLYNHLLQLCQDDYALDNTLNLMKNRNLRNQVPKLKGEFLFLTTVYSSPLKNAALRLKTTYDRFFKGIGGYPKFKSLKKQWFSLYYDEPNKGFKINNQSLTISLGKNEKNKTLRVTGKLKEALKKGKLRTFRLTKENNKFYGIFTLEKDKPQKIKPKSFISLDPNHKNFFVGIDNKGNTVEFKNIYQIKYFDKKIDYLKSCRDKCKRRHKQIITDYGKTYYVPSRTWVKYDNAIKRAENRRREQIKSIMYSYAHYIATNYDEVLIGDYTPNKGVAPFKNMHRSMLNQTLIGVINC